MAILLAMAVVLSILESALPPLPMLPPNARLGLSNIIVMYTMFFLGKKNAYGMAVLKSVFVAFTRGAIAGMMSFLGGVTSLTFMVIMLLIFKKNISYILLSVVGAIGHNIGQLIGASIQLGLNVVKYYWAIFLISGVFFGVITGILLKFVMPVFNRIIGIDDYHEKSEP